LRKRIICLCFFILSIGSFSVFAQHALVDADKAFSLSETNRLPVLLIFSGSDWCSPCIRFEKKILSDAVFQDFAKQNLVLLNADFPQRKSLALEVQKQNDQLAEKYNPDGEFPHLVLIHPQTKRVILLSYNKQTPTEFISELRTRISYEQHTGSK
jgi:thioredoxin-related protein